MIVVGDVHSCADALENIIKKNTRDRIILCGDVFDRGLNGVRVWELIHEYNLKVVRGNHEQKLLNYFRAKLEGKEFYLPYHYKVFLDNFVKKYNLCDLVTFLNTLPLLMQIDSNTLVTHAAVNLDDPWLIDSSTNTYGRINGKIDDQWYEKYRHDTFVCFGHQVFKDGPLVRSNCIGLDTGACHGLGLTWYDTETKQYFTEPTEDEYSKLQSNYGK